MATEIIRQEAFEDMQLAVIEHEGEEWFSAKDIGQALGFSEPRKSIINILNKNRGEFEGLHRVTKLMTHDKDGVSRKHQYLIFNLQAVQKFGFFAQTPRAKAFRHWASKLLAHGVQQMKTHILALEDLVQAQADGMLAAKEHIHKLETAKTQARKQKALPPPRDPHFIKVHRQDLAHLLRWADSRDPRSSFILKRHLRTLQEYRRLDLDAEDYPRPHDSLLTQDNFRDSAVWRLLNTLGKYAETRQARREVKYTALWITRLHHLFDSLNRDLAAFQGMIHELPLHLLDTESR